MRVIAGTARGKNLQALPGEDITRPTINRVKEAMFSSVQFLVPGARVLDLFAGSGQLGIEALSRGAKSCLFVDRSAEALAVVRANCKTAGVERQSDIRQSEAEGFLANIRGPFELALLDPPFHQNTVAAVLPLLAAKMAPGGVVLCETEREANLPEQAGALTLVAIQLRQDQVSRMRGRGMNVEELLELMEETLEAGTAVSARV
ncbi:MAG: 16S rRNA (guanine(966)-N(2))-methyltransferase RsmD [Gemmiger sp.]